MQTIDFELQNIYLFYIYIVQKFILNWQLVILLLLHYYYKFCSQIEVPEHSNCRLVPY